MRECKKCGEAKPPSEYYATRPVVCRVCLCAESRTNRAKKIDEYRAKERVRATRYIERRSARTTLWRRTHKAEFSAQQKVRHAIRTGKLSRPNTCEGCAVVGVRIEAHHADYSKPLEVEWLCKPCHAKADQERRAA